MYQWCHAPTEVLPHRSKGQLYTHSPLLLASLHVEISRIRVSNHWNYVLIIFWKFPCCCWPVEQVEMWYMFKACTGISYKVFQVSILGFFTSDLSWIEGLTNRKDSFEIQGCKSPTTAFPNSQCSNLRLNLYCLCVHAYLGRFKIVRACGSAHQRCDAAFALVLVDIGAQHCRPSCP